MKSFRIAALALALAACSGNNGTSVDAGNPPKDAAVDSGPGADLGSRCGTCALPAPCGEPVPDCVCECSAGEILGGMVCTEAGCLVPVQDDMGSTDAGPLDDGGATDGGATDAGGPDTGTADAGTPDAGTDPYEGRPTGQCTENLDCPETNLGRDCSEALPGGACLGCGTDADCPSGTSCSMFSACTTDCVEDADCPPGLECKGNNACGAIRCDNGICPVPLFGCSDSDLCTRVDCSADATLCPDGTTCTSGWCIEDRSL